MGLPCFTMVYHGKTHEKWREMVKKSEEVASQVFKLEIAVDDMVLMMALEARLGCSNESLDVAKEKGEHLRHD